MKKIIYFSLFILLISCGKKNETFKKIETENLTQKQIDSILTDFNFEYNNPVFIDSTESVLLPITTKFQTTKTLINKGSSYSGISYPKYWNILFYDSESEETNLLTESKMSISYLDYNLKNVGQLLSKSILYKIRTSDYNNDSKLNVDDPEYLFVSDNYGKKLRQLSPTNENIISYSIIPDTDQIVFRTKRDTDKNLKFDKEDAIIWYKLDLNFESELIEIVNSDKRNKIENLYFDQWIRKQ